MESSLNVYSLAQLFPQKIFATLEKVYCSCLQPSNFAGRYQIQASRNFRDLGQIIHRTETIYTHFTLFKESTNEGCKYLTGHITHDYFFCCSSWLRHGFRASLIAWASGLLSQARFSDSKTVTFSSVAYNHAEKREYKRHSHVAVYNRETQ